MKLTVSFKHMEHTPSLDQKIKEKSEKFEKYFEGATAINWVCWVEGINHYCEVKVFGPHFEFFAKGHAESMYKCLDITCEKLERQFEKKKDKWRNRVHSHKSIKYSESA